MDAFTTKVLLDLDRLIESRRHWQSQTERDEFFNVGWLVAAQGKGFKKATNKLGYLVRAASKILRREYKNRFSVCGGALSLNEVDEDGRLIFEPAEHEVEVSIFEELRNKLTPAEIDQLDQFAQRGTSKIAEEWGCTQRKAQMRQKDFVKSVKARLAGESGAQGDLFGREG